MKKWSIDFKFFSPAQYTIGVEGNRYEKSRHRHSRPSPQKTLECTLTTFFWKPLHIIIMSIPTSLERGTDNNDD